MQRLEVIVNKLNRRKSPVTDFANKENVVNVLKKGDVFESVGELTNKLGKWYVGKDGLYVWEGGLERQESTTGQTYFIPKDKKTKEKTSTLSWGLQKLSITDFWKEAGNKGENTTIAILDTGISSTHPEFDYSNIKRINVINGDHIAEDSNGHGSHVAGIIAAQGEKITGASPKVRLLIIKVAETLDAWSIENVVKGFQLAIEANVDVISVSGEFPDTESNLEDLKKKVAEATAKGIVTVASAGNNYNDFPVDSYPAAYDECISVGSIKQDGTRADSSSRSTKLDVVAPGEEIFSTWTGSGYKTDSGTSMATPLVSGIVAVLKSYGKQKLGRNLSPYELQIIINKSADDAGDKGFDTSYGFGVINPINALKMLTH